MFVASFAIVLLVWSGVNRRVLVGGSRCFNSRREKIPPEIGLLSYVD
jgi:hypothetical protein